MSESEIVFEEGIIGVPRARRFVLLERPGSPLRMLRSLDIEGFALPVVDPTLVDADYRPRLGPRVARAIGLGDDDPVVMLAIASREPGGTTVNLRAPVIINVGRRLAAQVILENRAYPLRAPFHERSVASAAPVPRDRASETDVHDHEECHG